MTQYRIILTGLFALFFSTAIAADTFDDEQVIRTQISRLFSDQTIGVIEKSEFPGIYRVDLGADVLYVTGDGRYAFVGQVYDVSEKKNLSEERRARLRREVLQKVPDEEMIIFRADEEKHVAHVFIDVDCGYCQLMHKEVDQFNALGITIKYLAYPRKGLSSKTYQKMRDVWCSDDPAKELTASMQNTHVLRAATDCIDPIGKEFSLGRMLDVRGTPSIIDEHGRKYGGYMPPDDMLRAFQHPL